MKKRSLVFRMGVFDHNSVITEEWTEGGGTKKLHRNITCEEKAYSKLG